MLTQDSTLTRLAGLRTNPAVADKSAAVGCRQDLLIYLRTQSSSEESSNLIFWKGIDCRDKLINTGDKLKFKDEFYSE